MRIFFFARGVRQEPQDFARRDTLLLLLRAADHLQSFPAIDSARWLFYAGQDEAGSAFHAGSDRLEEQRQRWRVYHANDLLHFCYETLLKFVLGVLSEYRSGTTLTALINECVERLLGSRDAAPLTWSAFSDSVPDVPNPADPDLYGSELALLNQAASVEGDARHAGADAAWAALSLFVVVMRRAAPREEFIAQQFANLSPDAFRSLVTESAFLKGFKEQKFSVAIAAIIEERVIQRHLYVANQKFRHQGDYTHLIDSDEGRVRLRASSDPVLTNPRMGPAISFLEDLYLIDENGLTPQGRSVVEVL